MIRALLVAALVAGSALPAAAQGGVSATRFDAAAARRAVQDADRALSRSTEAREIEAFAALLDTDTLFVSESGPPARGRDAVRRRWAQFFDPAGPSLTWEPYEGEISSQGDLGYTRGKFLFQGKDPAGKDVTERGEYLSIWRKQPDGAWRVVVDSSVPATDLGLPPVKGAPTRVIAEGASGDLRYSVAATRVEPAGTGRDAGAGRERRLVRIERRSGNGAWSTVAQAVTYGTAPDQ
jgi:ketosteroid isomerase-like protein